MNKELKFSKFHGFDYFNFGINLDIHALQSQRFHFIWQNNVIFT